MSERDRTSRGPGQADELEDIEIALLLEGIYRRYGYDFRNYAQTTVSRRIAHRVRAEGLSSISALQEKVLRDPRAMERLFNDFTIQVTEMFRDPAYFLAFRQFVVPQLQQLPYIRIWHAGCSTGEEVVSMAVMLHEEQLLHKTRIYATDLNDSLLRQARSGLLRLDKMKLYTSNYMKAGGKAAFSEYYTAGETSAKFHSFLTEHVVFALHNLVTDHLFNEFQVVVCRNVLIYFNSQLQSRVQRLFYDSLSVGGILGLGSRESIAFTPCASCYEEVVTPHKLYRKMS